MDKYHTKLTKVGEGGYGTVYRVKKKDLDHDVALKIISKHDGSIDAMNKILVEFSVAKKLAHPNICKYNELFLTQHEDGGDVSIVFEMEYCKDGTLHHYIMRNTLTENQLLDFASQIAAALEFMHLNNVIHRDLKPQNVLMMGKLLKISDFGTSKLLTILDLKTICGTFFYVAPEVVQEKGYGFQSDVFSFGAILYFAVIRSDEGILSEKIKNSECFQRDVRENVKKNGYSPLTANIILACCQGDPSKRPTPSSLKKMIDEKLNSRLHRYWVCTSPIQKENCSFEVGHIVKQIDFKENTVYFEQHFVVLNTRYKYELSHSTLKGELQILPVHARMFRVPKSGVNVPFWDKIPDDENNNILGFIRPADIIECLEWIEKSPTDQWIRHHRGYSKYTSKTEVFARNVSLPWGTTHELYVFEKKLTNSPQIMKLDPNTILDVHEVTGDWVSHEVNGKLYWSLFFEENLSRAVKMNSKCFQVLKDRLEVRERPDIELNPIKHTLGRTIFSTEDEQEEYDDGIHIWFRHHWGWSVKYKRIPAFREIFKPKYTILKNQEQVWEDLSSKTISLLDVGFNITWSWTQCKEVCSLISFRDLLITGFGGLSMQNSFLYLRLLLRRNETIVRSVSRTNKFLIVGASDPFIIACLARINYPAKVFVYESNPRVLQNAITKVKLDPWSDILVKKGYLVFLPDTKMAVTFKNTFFQIGMNVEDTWKQIVEWHTPESEILAPEIDKRGLLAQCRVLKMHKNGSTLITGETMRSIILK